MNNNIPELSHDEKSIQMRKDEQAAIMDTLGKQFTAFKSLDLQHQTCVVQAVQVAQEMGWQIELYFGRDTLPEKYFSQIAPALCTDGEAHIGFGKGLVALRNRHKDADGKNIPITNYAIAAAELEKLEVQLRLLDAGTRQPIDDPKAMVTEAQMRDEKVKSVFDMWTRLSLDWIETAKELPPEKLRTYELDTLLTSGRPAFEMYQRALLERKGREA